MLKVKKFRCHLLYANIIGFFAKVNCEKIRKDHLNELRDFNEIFKKDS